MRGHFIITALVFFLRRHSPSTNDVGVIFHFLATQPTLVRIHFVADVLLNRISIQGLVLGGYQSGLLLHFKSPLTNQPHTSLDLMTLVSLWNFPWSLMVTLDLDFSLRTCFSYSSLMFSFTRLFFLFLPLTRCVSLRCLQDKSPNTCINLLHTFQPQ